MKAMELRNVFHYTNDKALQVHQERVKAVKKVVDNSEPASLSSRVHSPRRHLERKKERRDVIAKENLILARKIFNIMEGTSMITDSINDTKHFDNHPGTMNFKFRLSEAQRIHNRNMILAARLDSIQPYYKMSDIYVAQPIKRKSKKKKTKFARELEYAMNEMRGDTAPNSARSDSPTTDYLKGFNFANSSTVSGQHSPSGRQSTDVQYSRQKPHTVLLEYTKVQDGRVLSVAVLKEPFRDRYAIFGIDVDVGQRYELRLTSDEVSSILDGDILVTSVDNVEVWMALLNKVSLNKVEDFAKLPFTGEEVDLFNQENEQLQQQQQSIQQQGMVASRPTTERPSSERPSSRATTSRGGARSRGSGHHTNAEQPPPSSGRSVTSATSAPAEKATSATTTVESNPPPSHKEVIEEATGPESAPSPEPKKPTVPKLNLNSQTVGSNRLSMAKHRPEVPSSSSAKSSMSNTTPRTNNKGPTITSSNNSNKQASPDRVAAPSGASAVAASTDAPVTSTPVAEKPAAPVATSSVKAAPAAKDAVTAAVTVASPTAVSAPAGAKPQYTRKSVREAPAKPNNGATPATATAAPATITSAAAAVAANQKAVVSPVSAKVTNKPKSTPAKKPEQEDASEAVVERPKTALERLIVGEAFIENAVMQAINNVCNATERATQSRQAARRAENNVDKTSD